MFTEITASGGAGGMRFLFEDFELDIARRELRRGAAPVWFAPGDRLPVR